MVGIENYWVLKVLENFVIATKSIKGVLEI